MERDAEWYSTEGLEKRFEIGPGSVGLMWGDCTGTSFSRAQPNIHIAPKLLEVHYAKHLEQERRKSTVTRCSAGAQIKTNHTALVIRGISITALANWLWNTTKFDPMSSKVSSHPAKDAVQGRKSVKREA